MKSETRPKKERLHNATEISLRVFFSFCFQTLKAAVIRKAKTTPKVSSVGTVGGGHSQQDLHPAAMQWCLQKTLTLEKMFENFVGTGNLPSKSGLGLMQDKGLSIMAENINR